MGRARTEIRHGNKVYESRNIQNKESVGTTRTRYGLSASRAAPLPLVLDG